MFLPLGVRSGRQTARPLNQRNKLNIKKDFYTATLTKDFKYSVVNKSMVRKSIVETKTPEILSKEENISGKTSKFKSIKLLHVAVVFVFVAYIWYIAFANLENVEVFWNFVILAGFCSLAAIVFLIKMLWPEQPVISILSKIFIIISVIFVWYMSYKYPSPEESVMDMWLGALIYTFSIVWGFIASLPAPAISSLKMNVENFVKKHSKPKIADYFKPNIINIGLSIMLAIVFVTLPSFFVYMDYPAFYGILPSIFILFYILISLLHMAFFEMFLRSVRIELEAKSIKKTKGKREAKKYTARMLGYGKSHPKGKYLIYFLIVFVIIAVIEMALLDMKAEGPVADFFSFIFAMSLLVAIIVMIYFGVANLKYAREEEGKV